MSEEKEKRDIGAIWFKESRKGVKYLSGVIEIDGEKRKFVAFKNSKKADNQPDYRIYQSTPRDEKQELQNNPPCDKKDNEDIPF